MTSQVTKLMFRNSIADLSSLYPVLPYEEGALLEQSGKPCAAWRNVAPEGVRIPEDLPGEWVRSSNGWHRV